MEFNRQYDMIGSHNGLKLMDDKPLPETMMTQFTDAYMGLQAPIS